MLHVPVPDGTQKGLFVLAMSAITAVFLLAVGGVLYWVNQIARRKQLEPLRDDLEACLRALD